MAAESNTGFHTRHSISFLSRAMNTTSDMIPIGGYFGINTSGAATSGGLLFGGNSGIINSSSGLVQVPGAVTNSCSILVESPPGLKHDTGLAVEWSADEQNKLQEGLDRFLFFFVIFYAYLLLPFFTSWKCLDSTCKL